ncbi:MAG: hypothetical protein ACMG6S_06620 [Byssovorax sp.]
MSRPRKAPRTILEAKRDRLNWTLFNSLENLLVFCIQSGRSAPQESGVHFHISSRIKEDGISLLFKVDRQRDSLIRQDSVRPDYLFMHLTSRSWIFTIIEMKGRDEKKLEHGMDQIKKGREWIAKWLDDNLPGAAKKSIVYQGILLTPSNAQIPPMKMLRRSADSGLTILPLQYHHKAELYRYVRKKIDLINDSKYVHDQALPHDKPGSELNYLESILASHALPERIQDSFRPASRRKRDDGIYVNYASPDGSREQYAVLTGDRTGVTLGFPEHSGEFSRKIEGELGRLGLRPKRLEIARFPG